MKIFISGTPGTGKTEIANWLGKKLGLRVIHVSDITEKFSAGFDKQRDTSIVDEERISEYLKKMDDVVVESHLPLDMDGFCFVLRCSIKELKKRLEGRNWKKEKIEENLQAEIFNICGEDLRRKGKKVVELDTTEMDAEEMCKKILCIIGK
jgi:adenylate kinase